MSAQTKMAEIINYVSYKYPGIVLDKKWNRLLRAMSKELEILEGAAQQNVQRIGGRVCECGVDSDPEKYGTHHLHDCPANR